LSYIERPDRCLFESSAFLQLNQEGSQMPIYDYECKSCGQSFEAFIRGAIKPMCEACGSGDVEKMLSLPAVHSEGTRANALKAAKKRDVALGKDRMHEQLRYEQTHDRHG
jgi:putative FmdB family regulatory protein